jgi:hypothetical protein
MLMEPSVVAAVANVCSVVIAGVAAWIVVRQLKTNHEWNRRKATHDVLVTLVTGEFPKLRERLQTECNCLIYDESQTYGTAVKGADEDKIRKIDALVINMMNVLETVAIDIKHNIIDEDICYDYAGWLFTGLNRWAEPLIEKRRDIAGDPRVLGEFAYYARKWSQRMQNERAKLATDKARAEERLRGRLKRE